MKHADHLTSVVDITLTTVDGGEVRCNIGDRQTGKGFGASTALWGIGTILARPADADANGAPMAVIVADGNSKRIVSWRDLRYAEKAGALKPGDTAIVTTGPARIIAKDGRKALTLYTEADSALPPGGKSIMVDVSGEDKTIVLACGASQIVLEQGRITMTVSGPSGICSLVLDPLTGIQLMGGVCNIDAPFVTVGLNTDQSRPGLQDGGLSNALVGPFGMIGLPAPKVFVANH